MIFWGGVMLFFVKLLYFNLRKGLSGILVSNMSTFQD